MIRKFAFATGATAGFAAWVAFRGLTQWKASRRFALQTAARTVETACGTVEFAEFGSGPAVLVIHGAFGGFDQAAVIADTAGIPGYRYLCPSRPGYLGTPLSTGRSPAEQADALAALLDELGIQDAAVIAVSAGGPVGIHFAARHPQRCRSLTLVSAISTDFHLKTRHTIAGTSLLRPLGDFATWMMEAAASQDLMPIARLILTPRERALFRDPDVRARFADLVRSYTPFSLRRPGFRNDMTWVESDPLPMEGVTQPVLIIHGTDDFVVPFEQAEHSAAAIPQAELAAIAGGGHAAGLIFRDLLRPRLEAFLRTADLAAIS
jgi:pimeloyl-ACP methyl ester carboxylesterase